jgi:hypothetical protein
MFPKRSQWEIIFYSIFFGHGSTSMYIKCRVGEGGWSKRGGYVSFYNGDSGVAHVPKILVMGQSNGSF